MPMKEEKREAILGENAEAGAKGNGMEVRRSVAEGDVKETPERREWGESERRGGAVCNGTPESNKTSSGYSTDIYTVLADGQPDEWAYGGECERDGPPGIGRHTGPIFVNKNEADEFYGCDQSRQDVLRGLIQRGHSWGGTTARPCGSYYARDIMETSNKYGHDAFYESHPIMNRKNNIYSEKRFCGSGVQGEYSGHDVRTERYGGGLSGGACGIAHFDDNLCDEGRVHLVDSAHIKSNKNPINLYGTPNSHMTSQENENDTTTYKIVVDTVLRIQSVFEEVYTYLHGVLFHLSTDGGFGPYTEAMASQLEAFRVSASRAVYTADDRLYYKDVELKYRRRFEGRKQTSYYKDKYYAFYEENKDVEAVKHLAKIEVLKRDKKEKK